MTIDSGLQTLLNELGQHMGIGELNLDNDGYCALQFDEDIVINFQYWQDEQQLVIYADLGVPASGEQLYSALLEANLFWRLTLGATLSLSGDEPPHVIIALKQAWQSQNAVDLAVTLERFVNTVEDWMEMVRKDTDDAIEEDSASPQMGDSSMIRV